MFRDEIDLITVTPSVNDIGDVISAKKYRRVFANKKSIRQSEFYQAAATGLRPNIMFVIRTLEYNHEAHLRYNKIEYKIIRTYDKGEWMELVCQGVVN